MMPMRRPRGWPAVLAENLSAGTTLDLRHGSPLMFRVLVPLIVIAAAVVRACLHFSTPLVQGMNGGYYLVQARSLIEKYALAIPDLPLVFTIQACLAKVIHTVSSLTLNESVLLAVKTVDSCLPALSVIPIMLLGRSWAKGDKIDLAIIALAAVLVPAGAPALLMVGDFEKNSLGLMLLCTLAWAIHRWAAEPTRARLIVAVTVLGLIGVTHIGVFGTTLIFAGSSLLTLAVAHGREGIMKVAKLALFAAPVILLAAGLVFWKFDPSRIHKLIHAFSEPSDYLSSAGGPGGGPPGGARSGGPMMGPSMFGPGFGGSAWMSYAPMAAFALCALSALTIVWWKRRTIGVPNIAVITGAALTVIAITGPWVQGDKVMRFQLNAVPLAVMCLLFALLQIPHRWARGVPGVLVLAAALIPSGLKLKDGARPIITVQAQKELQTLAASVEDPAHTLIVARHGLEWWTAWTLHTHIAQAQALTPEDWQRYKYVWFIEQKGGMGMGPMGGPGMFGGGPPGMGRGPGGRERDRERGPGQRPDFAMGPMPPPGVMGGPGGRGGRPGGGMMGPSIPDDAEVLHEGEFFKLAWVRQPPDFVRSKDANPLDPLAGFP